MKLKVNYREIEQIANNVYNKSVEVEEDIVEIIKLIESIKNCWNGKDSDKFRMNSSIYVKNIGVTTNELKNICNFIKHISSRYEEKDIIFENTIKKEVVVDE